MSKKELSSKPMLDVTKGYEKFISDKSLNKNGKDIFDKAIKKASKPKQRGSK